MFKKDLALELTEEELKLLKRAVAFTILNNKELKDNKAKQLKVVYDKLLYD